jgi:hypothetical protein
MPGFGDPRMGEVMGIDGWWFSWGIDGWWFMVISWWFSWGIDGAGFMVKLWGLMDGDLWWFHGDFMVIFMRDWWSGIYGDFMVIFMRDWWCRIYGDLMVIFMRDWWCGICGDFMVTSWVIYGCFVEFHGGFMWQLGRMIECDGQWYDLNRFRCLQHVQHGEWRMKHGGFTIKNSKMLNII